MDPSRARGPSAGPTEANGLPVAHGPQKLHGPRGHLPAPSLGGPAYSLRHISIFVPLFWLVLEEKKGQIKKNNNNKNKNRRPNKICLK